MTKIILGSTSRTIGRNRIWYRVQDHMNDVNRKKFGSKLNQVENFESKKMTTH